MKDKIFDYVEKDNVIYNLSGLSKLICFICMTSAVMYSYDIRFVVCVMLISLVLFKLADIKFSQIKMMLIYVLIFLGMNFILTYLFNPTYGTEIYGTTHEWFRFNSHYIVTAEQMVYQITKTSKYASVVPLGMMFLLTTNPSEFAASLNRVGISYKGTYAVSLTLRYFPDTARDYNDIALAQQSRGLDLSKKEKLGTRIKNVINICVPLILVAPVLDIVIYAEPKELVFTQGVAACIPNAISVAIFGTLLLFIYSKTRAKKGSLTQED